LLEIFFGTIKINTVSRTGNVATVITTAAHGLTTGQPVTVYCSNNSFSTIGTVNVTVVDAITFTYITTGSGTIASTSATGTVIRSGIGKFHNHRITVWNRWCYNK